jgi:hypothetical protein
MKRFFSYSKERGFETHESEDEAKAIASSALGSAQDELVDTEEARSVCWGEIKQEAFLSRCLPRPDWLDTIDEDDYDEAQREIAEAIDWSEYDYWITFSLGDVGTPDVPGCEEFE